jgi:glucose/arabinose dehydrogenase
MTLNRIQLAAVMAAAVLVVTSATAQQTRNRQPLGDGPWTFDTFEPNTRIRVSIVGKGLSHPYGMAFLPGGDILVTERPGRLRIIRQGVLDPKRWSWVDCWISPSAPNSPRITWST